MKYHCSRMCDIVNSFTLITEIFFNWYWCNFLLCLSLVPFLVFWVYLGLIQSKWLNLECFCPDPFSVVAEELSLAHFLGNWTSVLPAFTFWKLAWLTRQRWQAASCLIPHHGGTEDSLTACHKMQQSRHLMYRHFWWWVQMVWARSAWVIQL